MPAESRVKGMRLFGLINSNRDFELPSCWKKNIFNNAFPASLACYMGEQNLAGVYLTLDANRGVAKGAINVEQLFGLQQMDPNLYYKFESSFPLYESLLEDGLPRIDLVTFDRGSTPHRPMRSLEIKLTALPDNTTSGKQPSEYGCEIVIRPDSIVYLALSLANNYLRERGVLSKFLNSICSSINDWREEKEVLPRIAEMQDTLHQIMANKLEHQQPMVLQPVWRTVGQRLLLDDKCFDLFVWSNMAFARLLLGLNLKEKSIGRPARSIVWLTKMLYDFAATGRFHATNIKKQLSYGEQSDKAFSVTGRVTQPIMACPQLANPRVGKEAVREIILGGGENHLQPERRLDAALLSTPNLFPRQPVRIIKAALTVLEEPLEEDAEDEE